MEVTVNNTKDVKQENLETTSGFCNKMEEILSNLELKPDDNDCALFAYANNQDAYYRLHGSYTNMLRTVLALMDRDDRVAELFVEAAMLYSHKMLGKRYTEKKSDLNNNSKTK